MIRSVSFEPRFVGPAVTLPACINRFSVLVLPLMGKDSEAFGIKVNSYAAVYAAAEKV